MALSLKRPETTVDLCLDGGMYAEHQEAVARLDRLRKEKLTDDRLNGPAAKLAKEIVALQDRMKAETVTFTLRGLPRAEWESIVAVNPAREKFDIDKAYGFHLAAVCDAAFPKSIVKATQDGSPVEFDPEKDWGHLADEMTNSQYEEFQVALLTVNRGRQELPFSSSALLEMRSSAKK